MRRSTINFWIDVVSLAALFGLVCTGMMTRFILPAGSGGRLGGCPGKTLWGLTRHGWGDVHTGLAAGLVALVGVHVALHWRWVCSVSRQLMHVGHRPRPVSAASVHVYGAVFVSAVIGAVWALMWLAAVSVVEPH